MKLRDYVRKVGVAHKMAYCWYKVGKLTGTIVVVENMDDLVSVVYSFCARLCGQRRVDDRGIETWRR
jgi:predicted site-specific integrase-resolvase